VRKLLEHSSSTRDSILSEVEFLRSWFILGATSYANVESLEIGTVKAVESLLGDYLCWERTSLRKDLEH
jgi:hypothetical protein